MKGSQLKQKVKKFIVETKPMEALELINLFITKCQKDYRYIEKTVYIKIASLNRTSRNYLNEISKQVDYDCEISKINYSILNLLDNIDDDDDAILELNEMTT